MYFVCSILVCATYFINLNIIVGFFLSVVDLFRLMKYVCILAFWNSCLVTVICCQNNEYDTYQVELVIVVSSKSLLVFILFYNSKIFLLLHVARTTEECHKRVRMCQPIGGLSAYWRDQNRSCMSAYVLEWQTLQWINKKKRPGTWTCLWSDFCVFSLLFFVVPGVFHLAKV